MEFIGILLVWCIVQLLIVPVIAWQSPFSGRSQPLIPSPATKSQYIEAKTKLCKNVAIFFAMFSIGESCVAQIPTMDDYNIGSGAIVRKTPTTLPPSANTPLATFSAEAGISSLLKVQLPSLTPSFEQKIEARDWEGIIRVAKNSEAVLKQKYFGADSILDLATSLDISNPKARELDNLRDELLYNIGQLRDNAVSSRVYFFNSEDLQQIQIIAAESGKGAIDADQQESLEESKKLLEELKDTFTKISQIVG